MEQSLGESQLSTASSLTTSSHAYIFIITKNLNQCGSVPWHEWCAVNLHSSRQETWQQWLGTFP